VSPPPHSQPPGQRSGPAACLGHRRPQPAARQCAHHEHGHGWEPGRRACAPPV